MTDDSMLQPVPHAMRWAGIVRFVIAGAINTLLSILIYQVMLFVAGHVLAYGIAYVATVVTAYYLYSRHVFGAALSGRRFAAFAVFYVLSWAIGSVINAALIEQLGWHARLAIFATVAVMLPINYWGSKWCTGAARKE